MNGRPFFVYIVSCADGTLYTGWTTDLAQRIAAHNNGTGAKYTRSRRPVKLLYSRIFSSKEEAMREEWRIKHLTRKEKLRLIEQAILREAKPVELRKPEKGEPL